VQAAVDAGWRQRFEAVVDRADTVGVMYDHDADSFRHLPGSRSIEGIEDGGLLGLDDLPTPSSMFTVESADRGVDVEMWEGVSPDGPPIVLFLDHAAFHLVMTERPHDAPS